MASHELMRLCIGCRTRENTANLVRVALDTTSDTRSLVLDKRRVLPGRGAWLHPDPKCLHAAVRRRAFGRALRIAGSPDITAVSGCFPDGEAFDAPGQENR